MKPVRNIAVIAHVDHGKTTLVDALLKQTHVFRENQEEMHLEQILDRFDLEKERGITIMAKTCSVTFKDTLINIIDTPGHADFSGEVERTLGMADGALLIVDAQEGPMPQTRFVLRKALELNLKIIVIINKIDKKFARSQTTLNRLSDLFLDLATTESQLDFPVLYAIGRKGRVFTHPPQNADQPGSVVPLLDLILTHIPPPAGDPDHPFQMLISALDSDPHLGRIVIGRIKQGTVTTGQKVTLLPGNRRFPVEQVMVSEGLDRISVTQATAGDLVALTGIKTATIGQTLGQNAEVAPLPAPAIAAPTIHITLGPNTSPFAATEGLYSTGRQLQERLDRERENNVGLHIQELENGQFKLSGRGELHLSILLETMRREGYEMEVGKPEVITQIINGIEKEPIEEVNIIVPQAYIGVINQEFGRRQSQLIKMAAVSDQEVECIFTAPTRTLIGLRSLLLTLTKGTVAMSSQIIGFNPLGTALPQMRKGALLSATTGKASEYGLRNLKGRGFAFISPGYHVYQGMIIGQNAKDDDIEMNVTKEKNLTNHRSKSHQGITQLAPDIDLSLEQALDFLEKDELLEITPQSLRLRKKHLTDLERRRQQNRPPSHPATRETTNPKYSSPGI
jgi:GTP-binding protein